MYKLNEFDIISLTHLLFLLFTLFIGRNSGGCRIPVYGGKPKKQYKKGTSV